MTFYKLIQGLLLLRKLRFNLQSTTEIVGVFCLLWSQFQTFRDYGPLSAAMTQLVSVEKAMLLIYVHE